MHHHAVGFFVVNLFLAVIFMEYGAAQEQIKLDQTARTGDDKMRRLMLRLVFLKRRLMVAKTMGSS